MTQRAYLWLIGAGLLVWGFSAALMLVEGDLPVRWVIAALWGVSALAYLRILLYQRQNR